MNLEQRIAEIEEWKKSFVRAHWHLAKHIKDLPTGGSGGDADTLDGHDSTYFATSGHSHTVAAHNATSAKQGGTTDEYYHLTSAQHTDLTDGGETTLHTHAGGGGGGILYDTQANRPAANTVADGTLFMPTDGHYPAISNGTTWDVYAVPGFKCSNPPAYDAFSKVTAGSDGTTLVADGDGLLFTQMGVNDTGTHSCAYLIGELPAAPYTFTVGFDFIATCLVNWRQMGLVLMAGNATDSDYVNFSVNIGSGLTRLGGVMQKWTAINTWSAAYAPFEAIPLNYFRIFLRWVDDSTNRKAYVSVDGRNWALVHSVGRTDFCTPTYYGIYSQPSNTALSTSAIGMQAKIFHWSLA